MRIRRVNHIILFFSFLGFSIFNSCRVQAEPTISAAGKIALDQASPRLPHTKMELARQEVRSACHNSIQKKIFILAAIPVGISEHGPLAEENLFIKNSLLLGRSHLLFIYPFHHFW